MRNPVFFHTKSGNLYFFDLPKNKLHYCSQDLKTIIENNGNTDNDNKQSFELYKNLENNGYFSTEKYISNITTIDKSVIDEIISNVSQITFEVTEKCNLRCGYCSYSDLYNDHTDRENKNLSFEKAKALIDFFANCWKNCKNSSYNNKVYIGFYGGEPLINIELIKCIVHYINSLHIEKRFQYALTTNAILLHHHIDYLVENNFNILISLDGDKEHNSYRALPNGGSSFLKVYENILHLKENYPLFYKEHVNINSVLHNKNNVTEVHRFITNKLQKTPNISQIRDTGISPEHKEKYNKMYKSVSQSLNESLKKEDIIKERFIKLPSIENLTLFLHMHAGYNYSDYSSIIQRQIYKIKTPTGTCLPFNKKIFLTVNGLLLPCENVDHIFHLGKIVSNTVELDSKRIAEYYSDRFLDFSKKCENCYLNESCTICMYNMERVENGNFVCTSFVGYKQFQEYLSEQVSKLEESPYLYSKILKSVSVD